MICIWMSALLLFTFIGGNIAGRPEFITEEILELLKPLRMFCHVDSKTTMVEIKAANEGNFTAGVRIGCYARCIWEKMRLIDEDDNVKFELFEEFLPDDLKQEVMKVLKNCQTRKRKDADKCANAFEVQKCYYELSPQTFYLI